MQYLPENARILHDYCPENVSPIFWKHVPPAPRLLRLGSVTRHGTVGTVYSAELTAVCDYVAAKATYIRLLYGKRERGFRP